MLKNFWVSELMSHTHFNITCSKLNLVSSPPNLLFLLCTLVQSMASLSTSDTQPRNELTLLSLPHILVSISLQALPIQPPKYSTYQILFYLCGSYLDPVLIFFFSLLMQQPPPSYLPSFFFFIVEDFITLHGILGQGPC